MTLQPIQTIVEQYVLNMNYEVNGSIAEARLFYASVNELLLRRPTRVVIDGDTTEFDYKAMNNALTRVASWLRANGGMVTPQASTGGGNTYVYDHTNIRGE